MTTSNSPKVNAPNSVDLSLRNLFPESSFLHSDDIRFRDLQTDSRKAQPGQLFICLKGMQADGHTYAQQAIERGACGLLVEHYIPNLMVPQCVVGNTRHAYGVLCQQLFDRPGSKLKIAGITGTNGKTTTVFILQQLLNMLGEKCAYLGTIENSDGMHSFPSSMTTPDAHELACLMQSMVEQKTPYLAMEVSSHALDQYRLAGIELSAAVITNITHDHLDYHPDFATYLNTKFRIQELIGNKGLLLINQDDPGCQQGKHQLKGRVSVQSFGQFDHLDAQFVQLESSINGVTFTLTYEDRKYLYKIPLIGKHNVYNTVAALLILKHWGYELNKLQEFTPNLLPAPGRLDKVDIGQPFTVLIDYAHTPDAIENVLTSLRPLAKNRLICVLGAGGDRDRAKRPKMGEAGTLADILIITSDNPRSEDPLFIMNEIKAGCVTAKNQTVLIEDRREAIRQACKIGQVGDIVVIAGKGHESTQTIGKTVLRFNDKTVATEILKDLTSHPNIPS